MTKRWFELYEQSILTSTYSTHDSVVVILLVKIVQFVHVLLIDTINLAIFVVHFPRLEISCFSRKAHVYLLPSSIVFSTLDSDTLIKDVLIGI